MMTVRFQSGYSVTYNRANFIIWARSREGLHSLYTKKGGEHIATFPGSCLIEWQYPYQIDKPHESSKIEDVLSDLRSLKSQIKKLRSEIKPKTRKGK